MHVAYFEFEFAACPHNWFRYIGPKHQLMCVFALVYGTMAIELETKGAVFGELGCCRWFKLKARVAKTT